MTPERAAYDLAEAEYTNLDLGIGWWEELPSILEKQCIDRGDDEGLAFWVVVHTEYLLLDTHLTLPANCRRSNGTIPSTIWP